ncbi:MAG: hypothetical protein MUO67_20555 [Anaerolineales bacterium]|nr:hypothetical protein [Anaerolineales bacterium]
MLIPYQQLVVDLVWRGDQNCLPHAVGTESFGSDDLFVLELMIRDETKAQILLTTLTHLMWCLLMKLMLVFTASIHRG